MIFLAYATRSYLVSLSWPLCSALRQAFCSLAWLMHMFPFRLQTFLCSNAGISLPGSPSFTALKEYLSLFINNNNNGNILYNGRISYCCFASCDGQNSWSPAGIQGQLLTQGLEPRSYSQRAVFSTHYNTLLALSFSTFRSSTLGQKTWS